jgi:hypothetical protein
LEDNNFRENIIVKFFKILKWIKLNELN